VAYSVVAVQPPILTLGEQVSALDQMVVLAILYSIAA
jgi:ABC-type glutathione transport system ATPase component